MKVGWALFARGLTGYVASFAAVSQAELELKFPTCIIMGDEL
jgi:hypothetical protein